MLRSLTLITMRQHADEPGHTKPFALAGRDKLVEQNLCAIGKIAKLRFPDSECVWLGQRITVLET